MKNETFISIVLVTHNQAALLNDKIPPLSAHLNEHYSDYEILIVDLSSQDSTLQTADALLRSHQSIRLIRLSHAVDNDIAIAAGIENSIGDYVLCLNIESDEIEMIDAMLKVAQSGTDIVVATSAKANTRAYRALRTISGKLIHSVGYTLPRNSTGSLCLSRQAVNSITETGRYYCKFFSRLANLGLPIAAFDCGKYVHNLQPKSIIDGFKETLNYTIFNSTKPLRWMSFLGVTGSMSALLFSLYSLVVNLIRDQVAPGWTTTILFMSFLFIILFTMLSFFGEYLSRLLNDRSEHREYNVVLEKHSSVMLTEDRHNVMFSSTKDTKTQ